MPTENKSKKGSEVVLSGQKKEMNKGTKFSVTTHLLGKDEVFKLMALAQAAKLPILLVGEPGVAKTNVVTDYASAHFDRTTELGEKDYEKSVYILETDEGTKSSEVKGRLNMREFISQGDWVLHTPIADANYVVINEVDKASAGLRNSLLGVMNEKLLFNGESKVPCKWRLFVATCNEIPKEEAGNPFWDRFILKMKVGRMTMHQLEQYYSAGDKKYTSHIDLFVPSDEEIDAVKLPGFKLKKFLDLAYKELSDRTLTYVPKLVKIASLVYGVRIDAALVKVASIMCGDQMANTLSKNLISPEMKTIYDKIDMLNGIKDEDHFERVMEEINLLISNFVKSGRINPDQLEELKDVLQDVEKRAGFGVDLVD